MGPAAAAGGSVLRSFLVKLGFGVDEKGLAEFASKSLKAAGFAKNIGVAVVAMGATIAAATIKAASDLDRLSMSAKRADTTIASLKKLASGLTVISVDDSEAMGIVENIGKLLREDLGEIAKLRSMYGVTSSDAAEATTEVLRGLSEQYKMGGAYAKIAQDQAEQLGISVTLLGDYANNQESILKTAMAWEETTKALGIDYEAAAAAARKVMISTQNTKNVLGAVKDTIFSDVIDEVMPEFEAFAKFLLANKEGISAGITGALKVAIFIVKGGIYVFSALARAVVAFGEALDTLSTPIKWLLDAVGSILDVFEDWVGAGNDAANNFATVVVPKMLRSLDALLRKMGVVGTGIANLLDLPEAASQIENSRQAGNSPLGVMPQSGANTDKAMSYLMSRGMAKEHAAGVVSNLVAESGPDLNIDAVGDGGKAFGLAQWHPDRQAEFKRVFGKDIQNSNMQEQLDFVMHELNSTEKVAGRSLKLSRSAREAGQIVSSQYERPRDTIAEMQKRGDMAERLATNYKGMNVNLGGPGAANVSVTQHTEINVNGVTDPKEAAKHVGKASERANADFLRNTKGAVR